MHILDADTQDRRFAFTRASGMVDAIYQSELLREVAESESRLQNLEVMTRVLVESTMREPIQLDHIERTQKTIGETVCIDVIPHGGNPPSSMEVRVGSSDSADLDGLPMCLLTHDGKICGAGEIDFSGAAMISITEPYITGPIQLQFRPIPEAYEGRTPKRMPSVDMLEQAASSPPSFLEKVRAYVADEEPGK